MNKAGRKTHVKIFKSIMLVVLASCLIIYVPAFSDSIWKSTSGSPYSVSKTFKVGDILTVIILETTSAVQRVGTDTSASDSLSTSFDHTISRLGIDPSNLLKGSAANTTRGGGSTTRTSKVTARVSVVVTKVLSNGNLVVEGEHRVEVNDETQVIQISGMVRPKDVSLLNTVYSYQVAGADVSVKGRGVVGEADRPGFISRFFNWLF